jgi:hypothetical protein
MGEMAERSGRIVATNHQAACSFRAGADRQIKIDVGLLRGPVAARIVGRSSQRLGARRIE